MRQRSGNLAEAVALVLIAVALAFGGRALLGELHRFAPAALAVLAAGVIAILASIRSSMVAGNADRLALSVRIAYLTGLLLAIWAVAGPARWNYGAAVAILELAIVFDLLSRWKSR